MGNSVTLLKPYRTEPQVPAKVSRPSPVVSSASLPTTRLIVVSTTGRSHYAANRVSRSTGSEAERELKSKGLDNLHYSRKDSRSIRTGNQPVSSARRVRSNRARRPQVCIAQSGRELQAKCRWKAKTDRKEITPLAIPAYSIRALLFQLPSPGSLSRSDGPGRNCSRQDRLPSLRCD